MNLKKSLLLVFQMGVILGNPYLKAPQLISQQDIDQQLVLHNKSLDELDFTWRFSGVNFNCLCHYGESGFAITSLIAPVDCKEQFECITQDGIAMFAYTQGTLKNKLKVPELYPQPESDYFVAKPRKCKELSQPKSTTIDQLAEYVEQHNVIFYTGAGLSIASGVPAMEKLEAALHVKYNNNALDIHNIVIHAPAILENITQFYEQAKTAQPSLGHKAIAELAQKKNCAVFTENVDMLHQKSGINSLMVDAALKSNAKYFQEIDAIICVGLSHDDRGLLGFYKENNPAGLIFSIDLRQPDYLGEEDRLLIGDLQKLLPELAQKLGDS